MHLREVMCLFLTQLSVFMLIDLLKYNLMLFHYIIEYLFTYLFLAGIYY